MHNGGTASRSDRGSPPATRVRLLRDRLAGIGRRCVSRPRTGEPRRALALLRRHAVVQSSIQKDPGLDDSPTIRCRLSLAATAWTRLAYGGTRRSRNRVVTTSHRASRAHRVRKCPCISNGTRYGLSAAAGAGRQHVGPRTRTHQAARDTRMRESSGVSLEFEPTSDILGEPRASYASGVASSLLSASAIASRTVASQSLPDP
jgi:hypothetical protein